MMKVVTAILLLALIMSFWLLRTPNEAPVPEKDATEESAPEATLAVKQEEVKAKLPSSVAAIASKVEAPLPSSPPTPKREEPSLPSLIKLNEEKLVTDEHGRLLHVTSLRQAEEACQKLGLELPSIRELVRWHGYLAREDEEVPHGYRREKIEAINADGKLEEFFYIYNSRGGPLAAKNAQTVYELWSSSTTNLPSKERYGFNAHAGYVTAGEWIDPENKEARMAVRCVPKAGK